MIRYSIDGGKTYHDAAEGVRVIIEDIEFGPDDPSELHVNFTEEGVIHDIWSSPKKEEELPVVLATQSATYAEIVDFLTE